MHHRFGFILTIPLFFGCLLQTNDDAQVEDKDFASQVEGSWGVQWDGPTFLYETSCDADTGLSNNYFSRSIGTMNIAVLFDGTVVVEIDAFPEEPPCDLGDGAVYNGSCLDYNPYSTTMEGGLQSGNSFSVQKTYGGVLGEEYIEWQMELTGTRTNNQMQGEAVMKIIDGYAETECRTLVRQEYSAQQW